MMVMMVICCNVYSGISQNDEEDIPMHGLVTEEKLIIDQVMGGLLVGDENHQ